MTSADELYMRRAIELAQRGGSLVSPNPMVGAVIVKDGKIIAEGWHKKYGFAHAERCAIDSLEDKSVLEGATMYVTLEPCCHYGKTPPCADYIIENKISRVYIGASDPNPKVSGGGVRKLLDAGVEVHTDVLREECEHVCRFFLTAQRLHRPYIMLKWAESSDGYIGVRRKTQSEDDAAKNSNIWFTGESARIRVHEMRSLYDAIMVGTTTVIEDNPSLTVRAVKGNNPVRVTIDRKGVLSSGMSIFSNEAKTIVFSEKAFGNYSNYDVDILHIDFSHDVLPQIISTLFERRIQSLMVEGGRKLLSSFIESNLFDEINIFRASRTSDEIFSGVDFFEKVKSPQLSSFEKVNLFFE